MSSPKIPVEVFSSYIVEKLRRSNPHIALCFDESQHVIGGSVVHIAQAGAKPNVVKNRAFGAATAVQRGDTAITYALDVFTTDPTAVTLSEVLEINYDKTDSVLGDHTDTLAESVGDELICSWVKGQVPQADGSYLTAALPAGRIISTSGDATAVNSDDGQTGTRKAAHYSQWDLMQAKFNKDGVAANDRYTMLESFMYKEFINSLSNNQMAAFQAAADLANGVVGMYAGFKFLQRGSVLAYTSAGALRLPGEALAATDNLAAICWQKNSVTKAIGETKPFQDEGNPLYFGDIYSTLVKAGGRCRRADWKGVGVIRQVA